MKVIKIMERINIGIILITLILIITSFLSCESLQPLELTIYYPTDGSTVRTNLIKVIGEVSNPSASLMINNIDVPILNNGSFGSYLQLVEGNNEIKISAAVNNETIKKIINVTFIPMVSVYLQSHEVIDDYIVIEGHVFPPHAPVKVNNIPVTTNGNGIFSYRAIFADTAGIFARATYLGSQDTDVISIRFENGEPTFPPPGVYNQTRVVCDSQISVAAGQSSVLIITDSVGKQISSSIEHSLAFTPVSGENSLDEIYLPPGMSLNINPSTINVYPNNSYQIELTINTNSDTPTGDYWIMLYERNNSENPNFRSWCKITVTEYNENSIKINQPPWGNKIVFTDASQPIIVNAGDNFIVGFPMNYDLYPVIKEVYDGSMITILDNTFALTEDKNQDPVYRWFLFKALKTGDTQITIKQFSHLVEMLENQKTFTVVIR